MKSDAEHCIHLNGPDDVTKLQEPVDHHGLCILIPAVGEWRMHAWPMAVQNVCDQGDFWMHS